MNDIFSGTRDVVVKLQEHTELTFLFELCPSPGLQLLLFFSDFSDTL